MSRLTLKPSCLNINYPFKHVYHCYKLSIYFKQLTDNIIVKLYTRYLLLTISFIYQFTDTLSADDATQTLTLIDIHLKADGVCVLIDRSRQWILKAKLSMKLWSFIRTDITNCFVFYVHSTCMIFSYMPTIIFGWHSGSKIKRRKGRLR